MKYLYSYEHPKGKLFESDENPDGYVDTPTKLGINRLDTESEIAKKCLEGLKKPVKTEAIKTDESTNNSELDDLKEQYEKKFGEKPHHRLSIDSIRNKLDAS